MNNENFRNLASSMCSYAGAKVTLTRNHLNASLSNGSTRIVKEISYDPDKPTLSLSKFVIVNFREKIHW